MQKFYSGYPDIRPEKEEISESNNPWLVMMDVGEWKLRKEDKHMNASNMVFILSPHF
ncbi:hypothetical protein [Psychrobacillus sp. NEAU-3TGS]|uniref:hypothetical protein n=1 Tax=Psychrobacillus sp. NEAU-3TGS TaxID=2995412 RepID=UPI00249B44B0|nr:hypothetical protein [Psychrobacillus sp. NEAU-3TGS]